MAPKQRQRNIVNLKKDTPKRDEKKTLYKPHERIEHVTTSENIDLLYPGGDTAFKMLFCIRFCSAIWSNITDCDETYNYWEPGHFLLYRSGQQTWEYSPQYALRSYTYLLIHMVPAKLYSYFLEPNPINVFYFVRILLSLVCALSEVYFYKNISREFGIHIARMTLAFLILSSGMFISSAAFLPSSFSMYFSTIAIAAWYGRKYELAIFATAISALLGWPFAALLGVPIAVEMLFRRRYWMNFFKWVIISATVILIPMIWIDSMYYGKLVVAPLNILIYNVFTSHGPNLYGTEPFSFYIMNGLLNFNFVFIAALVTPIFLLLDYYFVPSKPRHNLCLPYYYSLTPMYLWVLVFFFQPHKEERFLFPIYPLICLNGAITVDVVQKLYFFILSKIRKSKTLSSHYLQYTMHIMVTAIVVFGFFGLSRTYTLYKGYNAPMEVMAEANKLGVNGHLPKDVNINFCVGKEWHRFPSSFFFPSNNWQLQYLKSEFKGQLPQAFLNHENATSIVQPNFNDLNAEEPSRYFDVEKCHFLFDLDLGKETILEPNYSKQINRFTILKSAKFLDTANSHWLFRAFYFPFASDEFCKYGSYNLLQSSKFKLSVNKQKTSKI
ncbi:alpha-1,2-mannosyltransferase ALG9 [Nasonia vitripennis]|uniref:Mannosyltransferase n=1 Tax=Nasonia vitripennis TaxID=7425 RepID=A0A7M7LIR4_NASVI|nr:alpha-1,2-mannosyltransferase ALG9 [Nasonia vitripennis]